MHLSSRSRPQHPYSLWLWCCWLRGWAFSHALWRNRVCDSLRMGLRRGAMLLPQRSQPLTAHSELCKGHQSKVLTFAEEQLCTFGWQYVRKAAPPLWPRITFRWFLNCSHRHLCSSSTQNPFPAHMSYKLIIRYEFSLMSFSWSFSRTFLASKSILLLMYHFMCVGEGMLTTSVQL